MSVRVVLSVFNVCMCVYMCVCVGNSDGQSRVDEDYFMLLGDYIRDNVGLYELMIHL
jgi:hypothetical protein